MLRLTRLNDEAFVIWKPSETSITGRATVAVVRVVTAENGQVTLDILSTADYGVHREEVYLTMVAAGSTEKPLTEGEKRAFQSAIRSRVIEMIPIWKWVSTNDTTWRRNRFQGVSSN